MVSIMGETVGWRAKNDILSQCTLFNSRFDCRNMADYKKEKCKLFYYDMHNGSKRTFMVSWGTSDKIWDVLFDNITIIYVGLYVQFN